MTDDLQAKADRTVRDIERDVKGMGDTGLVVVKAPPGAGKTYLLLRLLAVLTRHRVAVACFTNAQADDICARGAAAHDQHVEGLGRQARLVPVARRQRFVGE